MAALSAGTFAGTYLSRPRSARGSYEPASASSDGLLQAVQIARGSGGMFFCGRIEDDVEYVGTTIKNIPNVSSPDICCELCKENPACRVWMLGKPRGIAHPTEGGDNVCSLRSVDRASRTVNKLPKKGVISGLPFEWDKASSLFCFSLMVPRSYEGRLVQLQYERRWGIFGCDEYQVVSNETMRVAPGLVTTPIKSDLKCDFGGEFGTVLNTDIFLLVWQKVYDEARFQYHDWTVKADPDCVFFPYRLRIAVSFHPDTYTEGLYINNCEYGLHGPLEVLSAFAVVAWAKGQSRCVEHFDTLCSGSCGWGEDFFMDQCMDKVLGIRRVDDWNILSEDHCDSDDWMDCKNERVAFHPFKTQALYEKCVEDANFGKLMNVDMS